MCWQIKKSACKLLGILYSNCYRKCKWCEIATIYEAPQIFIHIPSQEKKVSDNNSYSTQEWIFHWQCIIVFHSPRYKKILPVCKQATASL